MSDLSKPKLPKVAQTELDKADKQFQAFDENVKELTLDRMNMAPKQETEPTHKLSQNQIANATDIYLKPHKTISSAEKFNEAYRDEWNFQKELVYFIPEHRELIGEVIETWTKRFAGVPAEFWKVPTGRPLWGPRYLAERIKAAKYHRLIMDERQSTEMNHAGTMYGRIVADTVIQRLDAHPATKQKSIFMGGSNF